MYYDCGIALAVSGEVSMESIKLVKQVKRLSIPLLYELGQEFIPHVTIYQGKFPDKNRAYEAWEKLQIGYSPLDPLSMSCSLEARFNGNIFWNVQPNAWLSDLHEKVAYIMQDSTGGLLLEQSAVLYANADAEERERIRRFGVIASGKHYHPHVTLARLANLEDAPQVSTFDVPPLSFRCTKLYFGPINEYGQMSDITLTSQMFK